MKVKGILISILIALNCILMAEMYFLGKQSSTPEYGFQKWSVARDTPVIRIYVDESQYAPQLRKAAEMYNDVAPFFAVTDTCENADVTCYDFRESFKDGVGVMGCTSTQGRVGMNSYFLEKRGVDRKLSVAIHELGHAIGLDHNKEKDSVMGTGKNICKFSEKDIERIKRLYEEGNSTDTSYHTAN